MRPCSQSAVQEALGQLVGAAREGLLALSVEVRLGVLRDLLELEVDELVGLKGKWNPDRTAVRHGHEDGEVTLGGRRVGVRRPRARTADGESDWRSNWTAATPAPPPHCEKGWKKR
jgi:putative transposase